MPFISTCNHIPPPSLLAHINIHIALLAIADARICDMHYMHSETMPSQSFLTSIFLVFIILLHSEKLTSL